MSESLPPHLKSCTQCGAELPAEGTNGLCPACLMGEAMQPTIVSDASKPKNPSAILTPEELAPLFPQYEILRMLGRGGMGAVYLARQISLNRLVAIKILPADLGDSDQGFAERFKNEAQAMARLSHPGIVAVYDFGQTSNGLLYIVMEYIEGTDVQLMLASQGRLHSAHAMAITAHVCDALQYAHSCGIIHRDIKPSNIMVGNNGVVKVADFGLAKMSQGQTTGLTQSGMAMGTLHFMAPEALTLGSAVDQRADIYAVGVMLYQMLTGKLPQGMFEMPSFQVPGLDPRYDRIVAKALRDDRELRYQAALELRHDLDAILTQPVEKTAPDAETEVKALPPVEARGRKKARVPSLPSPHGAAPASVRKKPVGLVLTILCVVVAVVAAFVYFRDHETGQPSSVNPDLAKATKEQPFVNTLGMKFVPVPITGGPTDGQRVLFSVWETRVQDYSIFAKETKREWPKAGFEQGPTHPAVNVSWDDAQAFCMWLTERERKARKLGAAELYRLPTDHEWSCAVGIGDREDPNTLAYEKNIKINGNWPWGTKWPPPERTGNFADKSSWMSVRGGGLASGYMADYDDGFVHTSPVEAFPADRRGLYDMGGNVWQWCEDPIGDMNKNLVLRGSAWDCSGPVLLLSSARAFWPANDRHNNHGFRLVLASALVLNISGQPDNATKDAPFANSLGMKFVPVPITGGPTDGKRVLFCIHETRKADYAAFAEANPSVDYSWSHPNKIGDVPISPAGDHPVVSVNWRDAQAFCAWLSQKEGRRYRLPTDHEWSCASGIGDRENANESPQSKSGKVQGIYAWGIEWPPPKGAGNFDDDSREANQPAPGGDEFKGYDDGFPATAPVMSFSPNKQGLYDLGGNVWEWCEDWWNAEQKNRVQRGASYSYGYALSSARSNLDPDIRRSCDGFRVVLDDSPLTVNVQKPPASPTTLPSKESLRINSEAVTKDAPFVNTLGMKFVPVPETGVLFCIHETRRQDYAAYARESPDVDAMWQSQQRDGFPIGGVEDHPVVSVSWNDANKFCDWLSRKEGRTYRLPTDLEWSLAAGIAAKEDWTNGRIPDARNQKVPDEWPWGRVFPPKADDRAGNYADERWHKSFPGTWVEGYDDGFVTTAPVMSYKPNQFGIYDLGGNVWEWCADWSNARQTFRVLRGGSWSSATPGSLLSSQRNGSNPADRISINGFRVVLAPVSSTSSAAAVSSTPSLPVSQSSPTTATKESPFINTLGMKFVPVTRTKVLFCIHETRKQDYAAYASTNPGLPSAWLRPEERGIPLSTADDHPVVSISWDEARSFCAWLGRKEGLTYRLPTDHEWSAAVGIADNEPSGKTPEQLKLLQMNSGEFPWGRTWPPPKGTGNFSDITASQVFPPEALMSSIDGYSDGFAGTAPVMSFKPNRFGLFDLGGNVYEMCEDWFNAGQRDRVVRGHSWSGGTPLALLSSNRGTCTPNARINRHGFRVVLELPQP